MNPRGRAPMHPTVFFFSSFLLQGACCLTSSLQGGAGKVHVLTIGLGVDSCFTITGAGVEQVVTCTGAGVEQVVTCTGSGV